MGSCCCSKSYDVVSYSAKIEDFEAVEVPSEEVSNNEEVTEPEEDKSRTEEEQNTVKRSKSLKRPLLVTIEESQTIQIRSSHRGEKVVFEKVQTAAPPPTKRTISVEAKSTDFIVDAPYLEGMGPDGSFMLGFNKFEMKNG